MNRLEGAKVFLAAPYSQLMSTATGLLDAQWRLRLDAVRTGLIDRGAQVFNAHFNERWGAGWLQPEACTPADFQAMQVADVVCAVVGDPPSGGVTVELGWASAMRKPILVVQSPEATVTPLITGLWTITPVSYLEDLGHWDDAFQQEVMRRLAALLDPPPVEAARPAPSVGYMPRLAGDA